VRCGRRRPSRVGCTWWSAASAIVSHGGRGGFWNRSIRWQKHRQPEPELRYDLACAIQALPDHYRRIVIARDIEERSIGEIAGANGIGREAVKARLRRAREMLREYLIDIVR